MIIIWLVAGAGRLLGLGGFLAVGVGFALVVEVLHHGALELVDAVDLAGREEFAVFVVVAAAQVEGALGMVEAGADEAVGLRFGQGFVVLPFLVGFMEVPHLLLAVDESRYEAVAGLVREGELVGDMGGLLLGHLGFGGFLALFLSLLGRGGYRAKEGGEQ